MTDCPLTVWLPDSENPPTSRSRSKKCRVTSYLPGSQRGATRRSGQRQDLARFPAATKLIESALTVAKRCGFTIDAGLLPLLGGTRQMHRVVKLVAGWEEPLQLDLPIADGGTYADAYESRYAVAQEDLELWLVALDKLIEMKREADQPIDRQDIERLS